SRLDDGIQPGGLGRSDRDSDTAEITRGKAFAEFVPGCPRIGALEESATRAAGTKRVGLATHVVRGGIKNAWVFGIHGHLGTASILVAEEDFVPGLATVGCLEHAALLVGIPEMAQRTGIDEVAVLGMNKDAADVLGVGQAKRVPVVAAVA